MKRAAVALVLALALPAAAEPRVTRLSIADFSYAEWLADGSGFWAIGVENAQRCDADGRPRGRAERLAGLPADANIAPAPIGHQGLSRDGKYLALLLDGEGNGTPWLVQLGTGRARQLEIGNGFVLALEWLADGSLVAARAPGGRFVVEPGGTVAGLCSPDSGFAVHAAADGNSILVGAERLYEVDKKCKRRWSWAPWRDADPQRRIVNFAFSPSGKWLALMAARLGTPARLYVMATDHDEVIETTIEPEAGALVWLDERVVVYAAENGPHGTSQRRLDTFDRSTRKTRPLVPTSLACSDSAADAPPRGGRLVFRRLCDDPKDGFIALVR